MQLAPQLAETAVEVRRRALEQRVTAEAAHVLHNLELVPEIGAGEHPAYADGFGRRRHGIAVEHSARLNEACEPAAQQLQCLELGRDTLVLGRDVGLPVSERN